MPFQGVMWARRRISLQAALSACDLATQAAPPGSVLPNAPAEGARSDGRRPPSLPKSPLAFVTRWFRRSAATVTFQTSLCGRVIQFSDSSEVLNVAIVLRAFLFLRDNLAIEVRGDDGTAWYQTFRRAVRFEHLRIFHSFRFS